MFECFKYFPELKCPDLRSRTFVLSLQSPQSKRCSLRIKCNPDGCDDHVEHLVAGLELDSLECGSKDTVP